MEATGSWSQTRSPSTVTFSLRRIICHVLAEVAPSMIDDAEIDATVHRLGIATEVHVLLAADVLGRLAVSRMVALFSAAIRYLGVI